MTTEWIVSSLLPCNSLTLPTVKIHPAAGDVTNRMYSFILITILLFFRCLIFIPKKIRMLLFVTVNHRNLYSTLIMTSSITSFSTCENLLSSTYQTMVQCFPFVSLCTTHMSLGFSWNPMSLSTLMYS